MPVDEEAVRVRRLLADWWAWRPPQQHSGQWVDSADALYQKLADALPRNQRPLAFLLAFEGGLTTIWRLDYDPQAVAAHLERPLAIESEAAYWTAQCWHGAIGEARTRRRTKWPLWIAAATLISMVVVLVAGRWLTTSPSAVPKPSISLELPGGLKLDLVAIPANRSAGSGSALPCWIGKTEVTVGQWQAVMNSWPEQFRKETEREPHELRNPDRPIVFVTWEEAAEFCTRLVGMAHNNEFSFVLPTEEQWNRAAEADRRTLVPGQDANCRPTCDTPLSASHIQPVAQTRPNPGGVCDLFGNVAEWCQTSSSGGGQVTHLALGGSAEDCVKDLASARYWLSAGCSQQYVGFRVIAIRTP